MSNQANDLKKDEVVEPTAANQKNIDSRKTAATHHEAAAKHHIEAAGHLLAGDHNKAKESAAKASEHQNASAASASDTKK